MEKGNKSINKSMVKTIFEGNILIPLPKVLVGNRFHSLFSIISPTHCDFCGTKLNVNSHYTRFILTSYGNITRNTTYWICKNCKKNFHDQIVGVYGSPNYSDEFYYKQKFVRYDGRCSLNNSCRIGERYTEGLTDICGRAPCASSLWLHEQKQATISKQELLDQNTDFDGTLYVDGDWIKKGWKKKFETLIGREITVKEWKKMRYKSVYVIATKEKVILDFEVTDRLPPIEALIPLFMRIKNRFPEGKIQKIVSDEDKAIIGAVKSVFPEVAHSFCVFHQLKNVSKRYNDEFKSKENIPDNDKLICNEICQLIRILFQFNGLSIDSVPKSSDFHYLFHLIMTFLKISFISTLTSSSSLTLSAKSFQIFIESPLYLEAFNFFNEIIRYAPLFRQEILTLKPFTMPGMA